MFRLATCMAFILTNSVIAQAGNFHGSVRIETKAWATHYAGETQIDGLPVLVNLDVADQGLELKTPMALVDVDTVIPTFKPANERTMRLNFIVEHNRGIQSAYEIQPRVVAVNGALRSAYVSSLDASRDFAFVVITQDDGTMLVKFTRRTSVGGNVEGEIVLSPISPNL